MTDEQFKAFAEKLDRIIQLLEKSNEPVSLTIQERGMTGRFHFYNKSDTPPPEPLVEAIGKPLDN